MLESNPCGGGLFAILLVIIIILVVTTGPKEGKKQKADEPAADLSVKRDDEAAREKAEQLLRKQDQEFSLAQLSAAKKSLEDSVALITEFLNKPRSQWTFADETAWAVGAEAVKKKLALYNSQYLVRNEPYPTEGWPIQLRLVIQGGKPIEAIPRQLPAELLEK